jgi:hypothetical protein
MPSVVAFSPTVVMYPEHLVDAMREANGMTQEQMPLRDAAGQLPVNVGADGQLANKAGEKATPCRHRQRKGWPTAACRTACVGHTLTVLLIDRRLWSPADPTVVFSQPVSCSMVWSGSDVDAFRFTGPLAIVLLLCVCGATVERRSKTARRHPAATCLQKGYRLARLAVTKAKLQKRRRPLHCRAWLLLYHWIRAFGSSTAFRRDEAS